MAFRSKKTQLLHACVQDTRCEAPIQTSVNNMASTRNLAVRGIMETCIYVDDLDAAADFYQRILGFHLVSRFESRHVFFRVGESMLLLFDPNESCVGKDVPGHGAKGPGHVAFDVRREEFSDWRDQLTASGVEVEREVEWGDGGGYSIYFRDPAGNSLELTCPETWNLQ